MEDALAPYRQTAGPPPPDLVRGLLDSVDRLRAHIAALSSPGPSRGPGRRGATAGRGRADRLRAVVAEVDELLDAITEASTRLTLARRQAGTLEQARHLAELLVEQVRATRERGAHGHRVRSARQEPANHAQGVPARSLRGARPRRARVCVRCARRRAAAAGPARRSSPRSSGPRATPPRHRTGTSCSKAAAATCGSTRTCWPRCRRRCHRSSATRSRTASRPRPTAGPPGKPPRATIVVEVIREGKRVRFVCRDDGRGVDLDAVRRGGTCPCPTGTAAAGLGADELLRTLLRGGISTSTTVTEVSGRGIGLDVVRAVAERLGGEVAIRSEAGAGRRSSSSCRCRSCRSTGWWSRPTGAPSRSRSTPCAAPSRVRADDVVRDRTRRQRSLYDGQAIPFAAAGRRCWPPSRRRGSVVRAWSVVIVSGATGTAAVGVDRLLGPAQRGPASAAGAGADGPDGGGGVARRRRQPPAGARPGRPGRAGGHADGGRDDRSPSRNCRSWSSTTR